MARTPANPQEAERLVAENLGLDDLSSRSLGDEPDDENEPEGDDDSSEPEGDDDDQGYEAEGDDADDDDRVSHKDDDRGDAPDEQLRDVRMRQDQRQQPQGERSIKFDAKKNIVDARTGQLIAPAGPAARFYVDAYKARQEAVRYRGESQEWQSRVDKAVQIGEKIDAALKKAQADLQARDELPRSLGLEAHETVDAIRVAAEIKKNPIEGLKGLLTRAAASGIDLTKLGLQGAGFDPASFMQLVTKAIDERMRPLAERTQSERAQAEAQERTAGLLAETEAAARRYFEQNPEMVAHMPIFTRVLNDPRYQNMSLSEIGTRIQLMQLRMQMQRGQNPRRRSLPNGRGNGMGADERSSQEEIAHPNESYDKIIKGALDRAGIR